MMGKKKRSAVKAELIALLTKLPDRSPQDWLEREIEAAHADRDRDVETLQMLRAALEREVRKARKVKSPPSTP